MIKKILLCIPSLEYGGAERVTSYLANFFSEKYIVALLTSKEKSTKEYPIREGIQRYTTTSIKKMRRLIKDYCPDIIIIMFAPMGITVVPAIAGLKIPYIISERNDPQNFAGKKITKCIYQFYMRWASGLVFQTHEAMEYYNGKVNGKCRIIYNPLRLEGFPDIYRGERKKIIVNVGRLHYQKNQELLIRAFAKIVEKYSEYYLYIYGEGELREQLTNLILQLHLENKVFLMGSCSDVLYKIRDCAMFVLSSDFEGMPNALIEALALGIPSISTDCPCGGPRELISNHINGTLIEPGNVSELIHSMEELICNQELCEQYTQKSPKIREILDENKILSEWEDFCNILVK